MQQHQFKLRLSKSLAILLFVISALLVGLLVSACGDIAPTATPPAASTATEPAAASGAAVYMRYCNTCHPGGGRGAGPSLIGKAREAELRETVRNGKKRMPAFGTEVISDEQLTELVAYVISLK